MRDRCIYRRRRLSFDIFGESLYSFNDYKPFAQGEEMMDQCRVLLVESDEYSMDVLKRTIQMEFPNLHIELSDSPAATFPLLEVSSYDLLICDANLRHQERISFIGDVCREKGLFLIVITGDTELKPETFSPHLTANCIHDILYKPLDLSALHKSIQCAMHRMRARTPEPK
jgi:DNA-binding NtrC family response regulator